MTTMPGADLAMTNQLTTIQLSEREKIKKYWPGAYEKQLRFDTNAENGVISPILRLCWSYLCNMSCDHCCAEHYMDRHLVMLTGHKEQRRTLNLEDVSRISEEAHNYGIFRFVMTGGEPTTWRDLFLVIKTVNPDKHLIFCDSNGWLLGDEFSGEDMVMRLADAGIYKMQVSLDSFIEQDHDRFRNKPGSHKRVMAAIKSILKTRMKLLIQTCLVKGRAFTQEFKDLSQFCTDNSFMLYVTYDKPVGTSKEKLAGLVIGKEDADEVRRMELAGQNITTHMTVPWVRSKDGALGKYDGCITVKGINTITSTGEVVPCPYMDWSIGNILHEPLGLILDRGMRNRLLGPHRKDCLIGEDREFMARHTQVVEERKARGEVLLPVPYGEGFSDADLIPE